LGMEIHNFYTSEKLKILLSPLLQVI